MFRISMPELHLGNAGYLCLSATKEFKIFIWVINVEGIYVRLHLALQLSVLGYH